MFQPPNFENHETFSSNSPQPLQPTAGHAYTGAVTVSSGGGIQLTSGATFNTYSSLTVTSGNGLSGGGTFGGATVHSGGRISPGGGGAIDAAPNTLTFSNLLTLQSTGLVVLDVKAAGADVIATTGGGTVSLGGELRLRLNSDYDAADTHTLLLGNFSGNFDSVTIRTDTNAASSVALTDDGNGIWSGAFTSRGYNVTFNANTGLLELAAIPEPAHTLLSSLGLLLILRRRR